MFKLNQKGLSLVQALVTLALLSGIGLMTMQISEKQALHQKRLKAKADLENFISGLTQVLTSDQICSQVIANIPGGALATTPGAEDDPGLRRIIDPVAGIRDLANNFVYGTAVADINENITINNVSVGPALAGGPRLQAVDLWINYTKTGIGNIGFNAAPAGPGGGPVVDNFKLDNVLTVELDPANVITKCYTNVDAIDSGIIAACQMVGGAIVAGPPRRCDLTNTVSDNNGLSISELENQYTTLENWADGRFVSLSGEATSANISAQKFVISQNPPINGTGNEALSYQTAQDIMADPQAAGINLCPAGTLGIINGGVITCLAPAAFMCPPNQRMLGINGSGGICANIITGNDTGCPAGQIGTLELVGGAVEFKCTKVNVEFNCTPSGWIGGNNPCGATYGACTSGSATFGEPACCFNPPTGSCSSGLTSYTCNTSGGGWSAGGTCGAVSGACTSGTPSDGDTACCSATPSTPCASTLTEYTCNTSAGGWSSPGASCSTETPNCSTTTAATDGDIFCCPGAPNPIKCPSATNNQYTCNYATGWSSAGASCGATTGACTSGSPSDGATACCASAPTTACSAGNSTYTCTSGSWSVGGSCGSTSGACTSGSGNEGDTACCAAVPTTSCAAPNIRYTCNFGSGWTPGAVGCSPQTSGCSSGAFALDGATECCPTTPTLVCSGTTYNTYSCGASGWSGAGATCGSASGACSSGSANPGDSACCANPPTTSCTPVINQYRCLSANWTPTGSTCGTQSGPCTSGAGNDTDVACCSSMPTTTCNPAAPTYDLYTCQAGGWLQTAACPSLQTCNSGSFVYNQTRCCNSSPSASCGPPVIVSPYMCNGSTWVSGSHSCGGATSGPCGSGTGIAGTLACCSSPPPHAGCTTPPSFSRWQCNNTSWGTISGSCSSASNCSSKSLHLATACCTSTPTGSCGSAPPKVTGSSSGGSGGGSCPTSICSGGSTCINYCPPAYQCNIKAGNCPASAGSTCQAICTTAGNHSCFSRLGSTDADYLGNACI